ncbi:ABC transporter substrate-binding protein [Nocardioides ferulae]|uniref:ABC transporter substrate-binding protein n=1 Tax=Nocardioides ferulae TaxID=2340821 RepID=UPI000EAE043E|nr:ABC transporter substrate-binding protein [Nocardioides ferulae]
MRRSKAMAAVVGVGMFALAACGGGGGDDDDPGVQDTFKEGGAAGSGKDPEAQGPAPEIEGAQEGGTITMLHPDPDAGPDSLDPTSGWSVTDNGILQNLVFRSLTTYRMDQETGEMVLVPDLATDLGQPNEDFTEWKFEIKDGIKWETGDPVTADDIAFGIKRSMDTKDLEGPGAQYSKEFFLGGDKYEGPYVSGEDFEGVQVDGNTITIKMAKPFPEMDYWGAFMAMGPVPSGPAGSPPQYGLKPLATGPYKVESFRPNSELVLVRNDQWDPATDAARHQYVDKWVMKFDQDPAASDELVMSGNEESKTTIVTQLQGSNYQTATQDMGDRVMVGSQACTSFWYPKYDKIKELEVRQALAFAYPYEDAWSAAGEIPGVTRTMGTNILPPGMAGREEYQPVEGEEIGRNPEKAKELLEAAGYGPGDYEIAWAYDASTPEGKAAMEQIKLGLEEAGFKTKPYPYSAGSLYDVWTDPDNPIYKKINVAGVAWCSDWPSGATFIPALFQSDQLYNTGGFSEASIDERIKAVTSMPLEDQPGEWNAIDQEIMTNYFPVVNTGYLNNLFAYGENIGNFTNDSAQGYPNLRDMYVVQ